MLNDQNDTIRALKRSVAAASACFYPASFVAIDIHFRVQAREEASAAETGLRDAVADLRGQVRAVELSRQ